MAERAPADSSPSFDGVAAVRVLFFGPLRPLLDASCVDLACEGDMSLATFWERLVVEYPPLEIHRATTRPARDGEFLAPADLIRPGDEIALIPPVSGG